VINSYLQVTFGVPPNERSVLSIGDALGVPSNLKRGYNDPSYFSGKRSIGGVSWEISYQETESDTGIIEFYSESSVTPQGVDEVKQLVVQTLASLGFKASDYSIGPTG